MQQLALIPDERQDSEEAGHGARFLGRCPQCRRPVSHLVPGEWRVREIPVSYGHVIRRRYFVPRLPHERASLVRQSSSGVFTDCPGCGRSTPLGQVDGTHRPDVPCDPRCTGARGRRCECSCGGANHGRDWSL